MKKLLLFLACCVGATAQAQPFVDTLYNFRDTTVMYGSAVDFGGVSRDLEMDISIPTNDTPPPAGRPLMVLVHGGAFMAGTKADPDIAAMREDFAQRGYVTAAVNYRLGMFQPASDVHCNISFIPGVEWDCLNQTDTLEWTRAYYRGIQDVNGAIRWLVNHAADYNIDPQNVFVVGESAGAFIAVGAGFMDNVSEQPAGVGTLPDAPLPNIRYEQGCLARYGTGTTNAALIRSRASLGSYEGTLNQPAQTPYRIKGVGDLFGGVFNNLFALHANPAQIPCIYIFHQPADLIVPFGRRQLFAEYAYCATFWPASCVYIVNRPYVSGGSDMKAMIDALVTQSMPAPDYLAELTTNNADCGTQINNPSVGGHQLDNYWTRTYNMAVYFAPKIQTGLAQSAGPALTVAPNPSTGQFHVDLGQGASLRSIAVMNLLGQTVHSQQEMGASAMVSLPASVSKGSYFLVVETSKGRAVRKIVVE